MYVALGPALAQSIVLSDQLPISESCLEELRVKFADIQENRQRV